MANTEKFDKLASISEYGDCSTTATSLAGLSYLSGYTRSPSGDSLNTVHSSVTARSYNRNGMSADRNSVAASTTENTFDNARLRAKSLSHKHNYEFCKKVRISMALVGILLLVAAIFMLSFYLPKQYKKQPKKETIAKKKRFIWGDIMEMDKLLVTFSTNFSETVLESEDGPKIALTGYLGELLSDAAKKNFTKVVGTNISMITMTFQESDKELTTLRIKKSNFNEQCFEISWISKYHKKLQDCFELSSVHWFGLGEVFSQKWPLDKSSFAMTPFLTSDYMDNYQPTVFGGVLEPFIINSKGAGIYVSETVPLYVSMNEMINGKKNEKFCIQANRHRYNVRYVDENSTNELNYTVCIQDNIKAVHKVMSDQFIEKVVGIPDKRMMEQPIWSTWVRFKKQINASVVENFAQAIRDNQFEASQIEIDDKYSSEYGKFSFDPKKFPNAYHMINVIKALDFRVTAWVYPFANIRSKAFIAGLDYWMKVGEKDVPGITKWWNGMGGILDTTNEKARKWFQKRLTEFQKVRIDGFKFDCGEMNYLPLNYNFTNKQPNPNYYSKYYVILASQFPLSEVRVAYKTQRYPVFVRILDRSSAWRTENGLQSVLNAVLTFSILGYPYVLPDMVGGNAYIAKPSKELYVRWAQLSAFLPGVQFSIPPWDYDKETVNIVKQALNIRKQLFPVMYKTANESQYTGAPIIRPLWWYWPDDHETFIIDTEFMLGDEYLIAPVLHQNIMSHAIYLPAGVWQEQWNQRNVLNMTVGAFQHYNVTLWDICYFRSIKKFP